MDEFYEAALKAGGKDHGAPGIRKEYHEKYVLPPSLFSEFRSLGPS